MTTTPDFHHYEIFIGGIVPPYVDECPRREFDRESCRGAWIGPDGVTRYDFVALRRETNVHHDRLYIHAARMAESDREQLTPRQREREVRTWERLARAAARRQSHTEEASREFYRAKKAYRIFILEQQKLRDGRPLQALYAKLLAEGLSQRSVQQCGVVIGTALNAALRLGLVSHNVSDNAIKPRQERGEDNTLTAEQLLHLFDVTAHDRFHALWVILGAEGLRLGEALGLKWSDIDLRRGTLTVRRALQRQTGKGLVEVEPKSKTSRRTVDLTRFTLDALEHHQTMQRFEREKAGSLYQDGDFVFASESGTPLEQSGVFKHWKAALEKAGLPHIRRHDLRHTSATLGLQGGETLLEVKHRLGHSNIGVTDRYSHITPAMRRASVEARERALSRADQP